MADAKTVQFIGGHEGRVLTWYLDPTGTPTIGYGFTWASSVFRDWFTQQFGRKMRRGDTLTEAQALDVLRLMIDREYEPAVLQALPQAKPRVTGPATSMVFNCGTGALGWKWAQALKRGDLKEGCRLWRVTGTTSKGKSLPGLVRRRREEADIAEFGRWPDWMSGAAPSAGTAPATHVTTEDIKQAQVWLEKLGYSPGPADGITGQRTTEAVKRFQRDHRTLKVDGIIGPATLSALQRTMDLQAGLGRVVAGGAVVAGSGAAEQTTDATGAIPWQGLELGWVGPALVWGGLAIVVVGLVWLAWRYQDEINALLRRL